MSSTSPLRAADFVTHSDVNAISEIITKSNSLRYTCEVLDWSALGCMEGLKGEDLPPIPAPTIATRKGAGELYETVMLEQLGLVEVGEEEQETSRLEDQVHNSNGALQHPR